MCIRDRTRSDFSYELPEKRAEIQKYLEDAMEALDANPHVERYCWFPYDIDSTNDIDSLDVYKRQLITSLLIIIW